MIALDRYRELTAKVDAFFARVQARHANEMLCGSGCHDCCRVALSVTAVEAAPIRAFLASASAATRARLAARASHPDPARCVALEDDGRCAIYDVRPLVCRSHGVPIRQREPGGAATVSTCFRNFTTGGVASADPDCVLDQTTLSTLLLAIDAAHAAETSSERGARVPLAELLRC